MKILYVTTLGLLGALAGATTFTVSRSGLADTSSAMTGYTRGLVDLTDLRTITSSAPTNFSHSSLTSDSIAADRNSDVSAFTGKTSTETSTLKTLHHGGGAGPNGPGSGSGSCGGGSPEAVPEPTPFAVLGVGALAMIRRKRKERNR